MEEEKRTEKLNEEEMSEEELANKLSQLIGNAPLPEEKHNIHTFLFKVATADDTTKLGYLKEEEIGLAHLPIRADKSMALISSEIMENDYFKKYFEKESEIVSSTSLSRNAKLINSAVLSRREIEDKTKMKTENKGWFKKKEKSNDTELS